MTTVDEIKNKYTTDAFEKKIPIDKFRQLGKPGQKLNMSIDPNVEKENQRIGSDMRFYAEKLSRAVGKASASTGLSGSRKKRADDLIAKMKEIIHMAEIM